MAKKESFKPRKSTADIVINLVIAIVIIAVLALAVVAISNKYKPDIYTVSEAAADMNMTVEQFTADFGLEGAEADDNMEDYLNDMTLENYSRLSGTTYEEMVAQGGLPESVTPQTTMAELQTMIEELYAQQEAPVEAEDSEPTE